MNRKIAKSSSSSFAFVRVLPRLLSLPLVPVFRERDDDEDVDGREKHRCGRKEEEEEEEEEEVGVVARGVSANVGERTDDIPSLFFSLSSGARKLT